MSKPEHAAEPRGRAHSMGQRRWRACIRGASGRRLARHDKDRAGAASHSRGSSRKRSSAELDERSGRQLPVASDLAEYISPRGGSTQHVLEIEAAGQLTDILDPAMHIRTVQQS